jgi:xanthine dehydrogenase iron-sulfur cluster and FAD-binding subunit A
MATGSKTTDWLTTRSSLPKSYGFTVNGKPVTIQSDSHYPLLWALRDDLKLTGTKFGCGIGECAVCLVDVDGKPTHSCITPVSQVVGKKVTTIEGLATNAHRCPAGVDRRTSAPVRLVPVRPDHDG